MSVLSSASDIPWRASWFFLTASPADDAAAAGPNPADAQSPSSVAEQIARWAGNHGAHVEDHTRGPLSAWSATGTVPAGRGALGEPTLCVQAVKESFLRNSPKTEGRALILGPAAAPGLKAFAFDVDSTLIEEEVIELLARHAGREEEVARVTAAAMRGELDFEQSLHARVLTLTGLPESVLEEVADAITPTAGALDFIRWARAQGHTVGAVSGGFSQVLDRHAQEWGLSRAKANELETGGGRLTGRVIGEVVTAVTKREFLEHLTVQGRPERRQAESQPAARIAVGDGANDLEMIRAADVGVAFCAKPLLADEADVRLDVRSLWALAAIVNLAAS